MAKKPGLLLLVLLLTVSLLWGCSGKDAQQTVTCQELTLTLPGSYLDLSESVSSDAAAFVYGHESIVVMATYEDAAMLEAYLPGLDALQYAQLFVQTNQLDSQVTEQDGIPTFTYTVAGEDTSLTYLCGVFQSDARFWVVQVYCPAPLFTKCQEQMQQILSSVKI